MSLFENESKYTAILAKLQTLPSGIQPGSERWHFLREEMRRISMEICKLVMLSDERTFDLYSAVCEKAAELTPDL